MIKKFSRRLGAAFTFSVLSSLSVLLAMFSDVGKKYESIVIIVASSCFWFFLVLEQLYMWLANSTRKQLEKTENVRKLDGLPGVVSVLKTPLGFVTDIVLVASLIVFVVLSIGGWGRDVVQYIILFLIVFSFRWHSIANGKNYRYKNLLKQRRKKNEVND